jgi:hypothetical protein
MNKTQRLLAAAKAIIADPAKWIKGKYAIAAEDATSMGYGCKVPSHFALLLGYQPNAVCFCSVGALQKAAGEDGDWGGASLFLDKAVKRLTDGKFEHTPRFNDAPTTTHEDVMAMFDKAIELAAEKQS